MKMGQWFALAFLMIGCSKSSIERDPAEAASLGSPPSDETQILLPGAPPAPPPEATAFQKSYDDEAAGKVDAAFADLEALRPTGNAGYVLELRRAWLLYQLTKHAEAIAAYGRAAQLAPGAVEPKLGALAPLAALRKWGEVVTTAGEVLAKDPGNYAARLRLAFAQYSQAKFADAESSYRALATQYPSDVEVRSGLGWALLKLGKTGDAQTVFAEILTVAPKNTLALEGVAALKR